MFKWSTCFHLLHAYFLSLNNIEQMFLSATWRKKNCLRLSGWHTVKYARQLYCSFSFLVSLNWRKGARGVYSPHDLTTILSSAPNQWLLTTQLQRTGLILWQIPHHFFFIVLDHIKASWWQFSTSGKPTAAWVEKHQSKCFVCIPTNKQNKQGSMFFEAVGNFSSVTRGNCAVEGIKLMSRHK